MQTHFTGAIKDTNIHFFGMQVDTTIILVLFDIKFHFESSPLFRDYLPSAA
jgi:hypothetical protein